MYDDILGQSKKIVRIQAIICYNCNKIFGVIKSEGLEKFPKIEDQPCPHCFTSKSGKKFDKNGKEIKNV